MLVSRMEENRVNDRKLDQGAIFLDADGERALAWVGGDKPEQQIIEDDAVPRQAPSDLELFRKASFRREP